MRYPADPLLAVLRPLDGDSKTAHESIYPEAEFTEILRTGVGRAAGTIETVGAIVTELEWHRMDRPSGAVPLETRTLQGDIERVPGGPIRRRLESRFHTMEAKVRIARRPDPAPSRSRHDRRCRR